MRKKSRSVTGLLLESLLEWTTILLFLSALLPGFSGCSTAPPKGLRIGRSDAPADARPATFWQGIRLPASDERLGDVDDGLPRQEELESSFQALLKGTDPASEAEEYVRRLIEIYYHAQAELSRFDRNLDAGFTLRNNPSYPRLLAWGSLSRLTENKIAYFYRRLLEIRARGAADTRESRAASEALGGIARVLHGVEGADRLALQSLAEELEPLVDSFQSRLLEVGRPIADPGPRRVLLESPDKLIEFIRMPGIHAELDARSRLPLARGSRLSRVIDATAAEISSGIRELSEGRDPQSDGFYPDPGPQGNITGLEFPRGTWALTFDDGPLPRYSQPILDNLKSHGIKATVFELAQMAAEFPRMSLAYRDYGMTMGNHSYTHPELPKLSDAGLRHEVADAEDRLASILGFRPRFFRLPYGAGLHVRRVRQAIADQGMIEVFWTVDSLDWQDHDPESIAERVRKQMRQYGRGIILFHDIHPQSVAASKLIMDDLAQGRDRTVTLDEIVNELNGGASAQQPIHP